MKNKYAIDGNIVKIFLHRKERYDIEALIDLEDFEKVNTYSGTFYASLDSQNIYAKITLYLGMDENGKSKNSTARLSRIILDTRGYNNVVDHINGNTLDNRKENLRSTTRANNLKNRQKNNKNNTTGYRNVCEVDGKFIVQLQINGKNKVLDRFDTLEEANLFAQKMREKYYQEFAGR
jgi:hypothetical protein